MNYNRLLQAVLDVAEEMLVCGAEVSRVEESIERMCSAYGCDRSRINVFIITSNIQVTLEDPDGNIITQIRRILRSNVDFDKLDYLNDLSRYICANTPPVEEIRKRYDTVMSRRNYPEWFVCLGYAMAAGGFAVFFGGSIIDGAAAAAAGAAIMVMMNLLGRFERNQLAKSFIVSFFTGMLILLMMKLGFGEHSDKIMIGSIMLLIPGIAMTNSVRDMLIGDIATGMLRLANSLLQAVAIACGFALSILLMGGGAI